ncbi:DNA repair protein RecN [Dehalobacterium formicoaceticum]|uniref:DNA repair protein RecN n=1 Tax=Dehalobacterium formicoaceticum TaxID=51515 RepID=UPI000B7C7EF4|nr:DNA repair protein RecN [Dehalobacterium formicoaceticum]
MLKELYVENFGLIEQSTIHFLPGFNVLTGETGAGKSLIVDALGLIIGGRGSQDFIRSGADKLVLQGTFEGSFSQDLKNLLLEAGFSWEDDTLIIMRELARSGKNTCRINCRTVPLSFMKEVGKKLVNIHGQHEHVSLLEEETQLLLLDHYGGQEVLSWKEKAGAAYARIKDLRRQKEKWQAKTAGAAQKEDDLKFLMAEIEQADLTLGEDEQLEKERKMLQHSEKISMDSKMAYEKLYGGREKGAGDLINESVQLFQEIALLDEQAAGIFEKLNDLNFTLEDLVREIADYAGNVYSNPERLDEIELRLLLINKLKKKYGATIQDILTYYREAEEELAALAEEETDFKEIDASLHQAEESYQHICSHLSQLRHEAGQALSQAVTEELHQLHMKSAQFSVFVTEADDGRTGKDKVAFLVSPNVGEEMKPVIKIASGGELSRIMLGLKVILSQLDQIPTLIFDEIDSGLGEKQFIMWRKS